MPATARAPGAEVHYIREVILRHLGTRVGKTFVQIKNAVENDYGSLTSGGDPMSAERRLYRHLEFLVDAGCIRREEDGMASWDREDNDGRTAAKFWYFFVHDRIPPPNQVTCSICGAKGVTKLSHASGHPTLTSAVRQPSARSPCSPPRAAKPDPLSHRR